MCSHATVTDSDLLSLIGTYDWDLYFYLLGCSTHQNLMSCSRILNSIKGFKLKQLQWSNITIGGLILCPIIAYVLWRIYRVRSNVKRFKPVVKIFNDKKSDLFNISDLVSNRLRTLEAKFSSLIGPVASNTSTRTELALPSTSTRPTPPPRRDSIPMLDINITPQIIQETVKDMDRQGSKFRRYQKYLQKQASEEQE